jgi:hypothetical protein
MTIRSNEHLEPAKASNAVDGKSERRNVTFGGKREKLIVLILVVTFIYQGGTSLLHMSATADETHYLGMGSYLVKNRQWAVLDDTLLHPPLSYYLHSLPFFFFPIDERVFEIADINERGRAIMASRPDDMILRLARVPMLLLGTLLALLVYFWARQAYGPWAGILALSLYVFNPVLLSNASIITPDMCLVFFSVLTFYFAWRFLVTGKPTMLAVAGTAMGLCLLSKYSAVLVVISVFAFILLQLLLSVRRKLSSQVQIGLSHFSVMLAIAILVVNCGYFFVGSFQFLHDEAFQSELFLEIQNTGILQWIPSLLPRDYIRGMDWQYTVVENGFNYFLLGEKSQQGWFHYYVVSFFLKSPVVFLLFVGTAVFFGLRHGQDRMQQLLLVPILLFPIYFSLFKVSRGIRYVLIIYPLLCVWGSRMASWSPDRVVSRFKWLLPMLLVFLMAESLWVRPHYLAYFNVLAGGPSRGQNYLFESEFDWGQELNGLSNYMRQNGIDRIKLAYFGTADPGHYGVDFEPLECGPEGSIDGTIAVSATTLQFSGCFDWLRRYEPVDRVGYTIFIYDLPSLGAI